MNNDEDIDIKKMQKEIERGFARIPVLLKRYSFANKMYICNIHSLMFLKDHDLSESLNKNKIPPWIVEIFALFSIMADKEYDKKEFNIKGDKYFFKIINTISNYIHPSFSGANSEEILNKIFMVIPIQQFKYQHPTFYKIFRYYYFFTFINENINMQEEFKKKFNAYCEEFLDLCFFVIVFLTRNFNEKILNYIIKKYEIIIKNLTLKREDFIKLQNEKFSAEIKSYYYSFKCFSIYPFVEENNITYFPVPHLLIDAVTQSLLYRLTEGNNELRAHFGKEVMENYLFDILDKSCLYDEVKKEQSYYVGKNKILSPDVLLYKDDKCVLIDSKSTVPKLILREFNENAVEEAINLSAKRIIKIYERIKEFGKNYYPFTKNIDFEKKNVFGVIVLLENNYISRKLIYKKAIEIKNINDEQEINFIQSNIKIVGLNEIESLTYKNKNIIEALIINRDKINNANWYDTILTNYEIDSISDEKNILLENCMEELRTRMYKLVDELTEKGLLKK